MRGCQGCCRFAGHIRGILPSVSRSFPIGAIMILETGGEAKFHPRLVERVSLPNGVERATTTDFAVPSDNLWPGCLDDEYPQATGQTLVLFRHASCASRLLKKSATHGRKREHKGIQNGIELR